MAFLAPLIGLGLSAAAGALGGGAQKSTTSQTSTPNIPSNVQPLQNGVISSALSGLAAPDLRGYTSTGMQQIAAGGRANSNILKNTLAARGLTYSSPLATSEEQANTLNTTGQQTGFMNSIPLIRQQLLQQNLSGAVNAFRAQPYGSTVNGTASISQPGGVLGGLLGGLGAGNLMGGNSSNGGSGIAGIIAQLLHLGGGGVTTPNNSDPNYSPDAPGSYDTGGF
jgi:hypothetical protein